MPHSCPPPSPRQSTRAAPRRPRLPLVLALLGALAACAGPARHASRGPGVPSVVFEAGLGDGAEVWDGLDLPAGLGRFAQTRAGYGPGGALPFAPRWAGDGDGKRTGAEAAAELQAALARAGVAPPYILVGHSLGALYVLEFARLHPGQVSGIVLIDPRLPGFTARCKAEGLRGCEIPALLRLTLAPAARLELAGLPETEAALQDLSALQAIPLTILLAERAGLGEDPRWRGVWKSHAEGFAARFAQARVVLLPGGHYLMRAAPARVSAEIAALAR